MNKIEDIVEVYAGCCEVQITDNTLRVTVPMIVMYPTDAPEQTDRIGPYSLEVSRDAAPLDGKFRLVLISHGTGGSPLVYRSLARHLARSALSLACSNIHSITATIIVWKVLSKTSPIAPGTFAWQPTGF